MAKNIKLHGKLFIPPNSSKDFEINGDDAIIISSNITGVVMGAAANGDPAYTREISVWSGGFHRAGDLYTRLSQAVLQVFSRGEKEMVEHNLVSFIMFIINKSSLKDKVSLRVREDLIGASIKGGGESVNEKEV